MIPQKLTFFYDFGQKLKIHGRFVTGDYGTPLSCVKNQSNCCAYLSDYISVTVFCVLTPYALIFAFMSKFFCR